MSRTLRIFLAVAFIIVIIAVVAVVLLGGQSTPTPTATVAPTQDTADNEDDGVVETEEPAATAEPQVQVIIAVQEIPRGVVIGPEYVAPRLYPKEIVPFNAIEVEDGGDDWQSQVIGKVARTDIFIEQPILTNMLADNLAGLANVGSDAAAVLPNNRVAVAVPMDRITSVAYAIQPGDRVDVIVSLLFVDVDPDFQSIEPNAFIPYNVTVTEDTVVYTPSGDKIPGNFETRPGPLGDTIVGVVSPSEAQRPRLVTQRTVQDALVIWLGDFPRSGKMFEPTPTPRPTATPVPESSSSSSRSSSAPPAPTNTPIPPRPDIITLGVTPQDAVVLTWFVEARLPLTFALRSAQTTSQAITEAVSLEYITTTFNVEPPGKRPYAIEPAITSIRELVAGNRIELNR